MKYKVIPTVFSVKEEDFLDRFQKLVKLSKEIQVDFMDGKFVSSNFMNFNIVPDLRKYRNIFEAHLMTLHPEKYIPILRKKGFDKIIFHYEAFHDNNLVIKLSKRIKKEKMKSFLAINPNTQVRDILLVAKEFDGILFMGVHPGKEHQMFVYDVLEHIKQLRHFNSEIDIQVDGGINSSNIKYIKNSGANLFNTGSFVSESKNPKASIVKLKQELK